MGLKRLLIRNLTLQGMSQAVGLAAGLVTSVVLSRYLGKTGFGAFNYVFAYLYFFLALNDLGVNLIVIREVSKNEARAAEIIGGMLAFRLALGFVALAAASAVAMSMPLEPGLRPAILLFAWILPLNAANLPVTMFQVKQRADYAALVDIVNRSSGLALVLLAVAFGAGLTGIFAGLVGAEIIGLLTMLVFTRRLVRPRVHVDAALWREVLRSSLPLGLAGLLVTVVNRVDFLMLERMRTLADVGVYSVAYKVTNLFERFPLLVMTTLYPVMSTFAVTDRPQLRVLYRKTVLHLAAIAIPTALAVTWLAPEIIVIFGRQYLEGARALRVLVWSSVCLYLALAGGNVLISIGRERANLMTLIAGAATNIALNFLWIPRLGYVGAALSTVTAFAVILVMTLVAVEMYLPRNSLPAPAEQR